MNIAVSNDQSIPLSHDPCRKQRTLVVGTGDFVAELLDEIKQRPQLGHHIIGVVGDKDCARQQHPMYRFLGSLDSLQDIIATLGPDHIIVALDGENQHLYSHALVQAKICKNITVEDGRKTYEKITGEIPLEEISAGGVIFSSDFEPSKISLASARFVSFICAIVGLALLWPVLLVVAILIKMDSTGSVFFIQERVGLRGKPFKLLKFRTMRPSTGKVSEWAGDNGDRITRVGYYLRKFRLDELPQFLNVLFGHMNLVGPRPHPISNLRMLYLVSRNTPDSGAQIPYYSLRTMVRPGITGWAQVRYRYANNIDEEIEKLRFDLYYVKHYSLWLDLKIVFETIKVVITGSEDSQDAVAPAAPARRLPQAQPAATEVAQGETIPGKAASGNAEAAEAPDAEPEAVAADGSAQNAHTEPEPARIIEAAVAPPQEADLPQFSKPKLVATSKTSTSTKNAGGASTGTTSKSVNGGQS